MFRRRLRGFRLFRPAYVPPDPPVLLRFRKARIRFGRPSAVRDLRFTTRFLPPVPLVCRSFCSWSIPRSRFVCFSSVSVQLVFACPFRSVLLIFRSIRLSFPFRFVFALFPFVSDSFRFRLILSLFRVRLSVCALILYYISRILYTAWFVFQMYFLSENMSFFEIVQTIDINFGEVSPGQETDFTRPGQSGITTKKTAADTTPMRESVWTGTKRFMQPRRIRRRYIVCTKK